MKDPAEVLAAIKDYCQTRLDKQRRPLNSREWLAGYDYVLSRILRIVETGEVYHQQSEEELKKEELRYMQRQKVKLENLIKRGLEEIDKNEAKLKEVSKYLKENAENN